MNIEELTVQLKEMLIQDELDDVIDLLRENLEMLNGQVSEADILQYAARLNSLEREKGLGIISSERYSIEKNQLRQILIEKITQLKKEQRENPQEDEQVVLLDGDLLLEEASKFFLDRDFRQAEVVIKKAIKGEFKRYDKAEAYAILGNIYNELDYFQDAIDAHQQALQLNPNSASYWTNLGIVYRLTSQYDKAEECYKKALAINPDYPELYTSLGALHLTHTMKFKEAIQYLEKAIELDPGQSIAYANMAIAQASVGAFEEADRFLKMAAMKGYSNTKNAKRIIDNLKHL
jgi:Flp pilus assembly protein TadD